MIEVQAFQESYLDLLHGMLMSQEHSTHEITPESIPQIGYIAFEGSIPVACGFLRKVEGGYAQIDGLTSNPDMPSEVRHKALSFIVDTLIQEAKHLKMIGIISFTKDYSIIKRAKDCGFQVLQHQVIALSLSGVT